MALSSKQNRGWIFLKSVHFRIFIITVTVFCLFCSLLVGASIRNWRSSRQEQIRSEADRYANMIASEIDSRKTMETLDGYYINSYTRVLLVDSEGIIVKDSLQLKVGEQIPAETFKAVMGGETVSETEGTLYLVYVPICDSESKTVTGTVVVLTDMSSLDHEIETGKDRLILLTVIFGLPTACLFYLIVYLSIKPLKKIIYWLEHFSQPEVRKYARPKHKTEDEYASIVEAVDEATRDFLTMDQSRSEFVSNVSHELKTPLSSIKVLTESLLLQEGVGEEIYREFLQDINSEIDRMNNIINDLLTLVRLEEGEKVMNPSPVSLKELLEVILRRVEPLGREKNISLVMEECEDLTIEADETKLTLAITNLIQNAIKYNREQGSVIVSCTKKVDAIHISVKDTGLGIDKVHFDKLFDRFYRVDKARDRNSGGSGLGLSIVKRIISLHRGEILVDSVVGEGSTFTIVLPVERDSEGDEE